MSLVRNVGTIGGLTAVSRVFGFARDMLLARVLGAGLAADAFQLAHDPAGPVRVGAPPATAHQVEDLERTITHRAASSGHAAR